MLIAAEDIEAFWAELLALVRNRSVIPIIGPELAVIDDGGTPRTFQQVLARHLLNKAGLPVPSEPSGLSEAAGAWLARSGVRRQTLYTEVNAAISGSANAAPLALRQLAGINDLTHFLSFCPDPLLSNALRQVRETGGAKILEYAFSPSECTDAISADLYDYKSNTILVYYLFGRISPVPKYVVTEDDILEWVTALQNPAKRPAQLFDMLEKNHLLFLGCNFPDWLARFILRTTKKEKLSVERDCGEFLIDARRVPDDSFVTFVTSFSRGTRIVPLDPLKFVDEFARRWHAGAPGPASDRVETLPMAKRPDPGCVFISYASEDRPAALQLAVDLQAQGLPVWLDQEQLQWAEPFSTMIRQAIAQATLFVPLLSRTTETVIGYMRKEWFWAVDRHLEFTGSGLTFLSPVVVDDDLNPSDLASIPEAFRGLTIPVAPGGRTNETQRAAITRAFAANERMVNARRGHAAQRGGQ